MPINPGIPVSGKVEPPRLPVAQESGGVMEQLIPQKNPPALIAYYFAVFSLIPGIGLLLAPIAVVLGIIGLARTRSSERRIGMAHALVGILLGGTVFLGYLALIGMALAGALA